MTQTGTELASSVKMGTVRAPKWAAEWKRSLMIFGAGSLCLIFAFWPTATQLVSTWNTGSFSHCYLIVPIAAYLAWSEKDRAAQILPTASLPASVIMVLSSLVWFSGYMGNARVLEQLGFVSMFVALFWTVFGTAASNAFRFPLAVLLFAVPFGLSLVEPLQEFTAWAVVNLLTLTGIPVVREGLVLTVPNGAWEVAEACSGLRYLVSSFVLGLVFSHLVFRSTKRRLIFLAAASVFPIAANALRAYGIVVLGYLSNNQLAVGVDHLIYGWIFFSLVTFVTFSVGFHWRESGLQPLETPSPTSHAVTQRSPILLAVISLIIAIFPGFATRITTGRIAEPMRTEHVPEARSPWVPATFSQESWLATSPTAHSTIQRTFLNGPEKVRLTISFYTITGNGIDVQHFGRQILGPHWSALSERNRLANIDGRTEPVQEIVTRPGISGQRVIWTVFWVNNRFTTSPYQVKLLQAQSRMKGSPAISAIVAVSADYLSDPEEARPALQQFLNSISLDHELLACYK